VKTNDHSGERENLSASKSGWRVRFALGGRWSRFLGVAFGSVAVAWLTGCATHTQTQYFSVKDPNTGAANYYRLSISGCGSLTKYNLQAGYYSAAAVDILRGRMPDVPELDLPIERVKTYDQLLQRIDQSLLQEAKQISPITDPGVAAEGLRDRVAREQAKQTQLQAEKIKAEEELLKGSSNVVQATTSLVKAKADLAAGDAAVQKANERVSQASTNLTNAAVAITNLVTAMAEVQKATNGLSQAIGSTNLLDITRAMTNFAALITTIQDATNRLNQAIAGGSPTNIAPAMTNFAALITAIQDATNWLRRVTEGSNPIITRPAISNLVAQIQEANKRLGQVTASANDTNVAEAKEALSARKGELETAKAKLEASLAAAECSKASLASLEDKVALLRSQVQFAAHSETTFSNALARLEALYPNGALGLDLPDTSTNDLPARLTDPNYINDKFIKLSRLLWLTSLSGADVAAVGMSQTTDPFQFRKLVFWAKSTTLNMDQAAGDVDAILGQVVEIGRNYKKLGQEREAARAQAQADQITRAQAALDTLKTITPGATNKAVLTNIMKMLVPNMDSAAQKQPLPKN
jgi:hypothetical protein